MLIHVTWYFDIFPLTNESSFPVSLFCFDIRPGAYPPPPPGYPGYPPPPPGYGAPPPPGYGQPGGYPYPPPYGYYDAYKQSPRRRATKGKQKTEAEKAERKSRKNLQSRARAARLRERIAEIKKKPEDARTEDDLKVIEIFEERRRRKNDRSRDRAIEKKSKLEAILAKPESKRSKEEKEMLDINMKSKARKNEGDRIRRERIKMMGLKGKGISVSVRGRPRRTLGPDGQPIPYDSSIPYAPGMDPNAVPMSPVPLHSPGQFASPGMMFAPSPGQAGYHPYPGMPPPGAPPPGAPGAPRQLQMPAEAADDEAGSSAVQQEVHADGSLTISIGGGGGDDVNKEGGGDAEPVEEEDV